MVSSVRKTKNSTPHRNSSSPWVSAKQFEFEKTPIIANGSSSKEENAANVSRKTEMKAKNRRQTILLKRLDFPVDTLVSSPDRTFRKTRRQSMMATAGQKKEEKSQPELRVTNCGVKKEVEVTMGYAKNDKSEKSFKKSKSGVVKQTFMTAVQNGGTDVKAKPPVKSSSRLRNKTSKSTSAINENKIRGEDKPQGRAVKELKKARGIFRSKDSDEADVVQKCKKRTVSDAMAKADKPHANAPPAKALKIAHFKVLEKGGASAEDTQLDRGEVVPIAVLESSPVKRQRFSRASNLKPDTPDPTPAPRVLIENNLKKNVKEELNGLTHPDGEDDESSYYEDFPLPDAMTPVSSSELPPTPTSIKPSSKLMKQGVRRLVRDCTPVLEEPRSSTPLVGDESPHMEVNNSSIAESDGDTSSKLNEAPVPPPRDPPQGTRRNFCSLM